MTNFIIFLNTSSSEYVNSEDRTQNLIPESNYGNFRLWLRLSEFDSDYDPDPLILRFTDYFKSLRCYINFLQILSVLHSENKI